MAPDLSNLATPANCTADVCLIPIGTASASISHEIADVQRLFQQSGLNFKMHSAGTTIEGPWDNVLTLIGQAHSMLHEKGLVRVHSDIRIGSRIDKTETMESKVASVEKKLLKGE
ncbi:hypothetical protein FQN57_001644 [Myotisia sp. PD_48]|nr:hypothetical protein FQN57_001644 [Myotisia sp. PD_48]